MVIRSIWKNICNQPVMRQLLSVLFDSATIFLAVFVLGILGEINVLIDLNYYWLSIIIFLSVRLVLLHSSSIIFRYSFDILFKDYFGYLITFVICSMVNFLHAESTVWLSLFLSLAILSGTLRYGAQFLAVELFWILKSRGHDNTESVGIFGADSIGLSIANSFIGSNRYKVVGFIDDNKKLRGRRLLSLPIIGLEDLSSFVDKYRIKTIISAIPADKPYKRREIFDSLSSHNVRVLSIESPSDLLEQPVSGLKLKSVSEQDLMPRFETKFLDVKPKQLVAGKCVLVTGAGGSIGEELCLQILEARAKTLILVDISEFNLYQVREKIVGLQLSTDVHFKLANVADYNLMRSIFSEFGVDLVFHAAAYKHVPLLEKNIISGVKNNILGFMSMLELATDFRIDSFVLVSSDKAVRPTNVMGASKRVCELLLLAQSMASQQTNYSIVRFGNVLGSSGSVLPKFKHQISCGGPVTVTHPDVTRYFMTVREAASLILCAASLRHTGKIFLLDMGSPIKLVDLAKKLIALHGFRVDYGNGDGDIALKFTGLREGEKLIEELLIDGNVEPTAIPKVFSAEESQVNLEDIQSKISHLKKLLGSSSDQTEQVLEVLKSLVPEYRSTTD